MAILIRGQVYASLEQAKSYSRIFYREQSFFDHHVSNDIGAEHALESGRYHLYLGYGDPWSHRVLISHALLKLQDVLSITFVNPAPANDGWVFSVKDEYAEGGLDKVNNCDSLYQLYQLAEPEFTGRVTVPVLWDCKTSQIISNQSHAIMRMLSTVFAESTNSTLRLYPDERASEIECYNHFIFESINNGVYKVGMAPSQKTYNHNLGVLFAALDELEEHLAHTRYLLGEQLTESDIRLFASLIRFDTIYYPYMKCNRKRLQDYANLWLYTKDIYSLPEIKKTVNFDDMMQAYYGQAYLNPMKVIPDLPSIQFADEIEVFHYELYSAPF